MKERLKGSAIFQKTCSCCAAPILRAKHISCYFKGLVFYIYLPMIVFLHSRISSSCNDITKTNEKPLGQRKMRNSEPALPPPFIFQEKLSKPRRKNFLLENASSLVHIHIRSWFRENLSLISLWFSTNGRTWLGTPPSLKETVKSFNQS